jgi:hypothetical protein
MEVGFAGTRGKGQGALSLLVAEFALALLVDSTQDGSSGMNKI